MTAIPTAEFLRKYECAICLEPLLQAVTLTPCNHAFNEKCVQLIFNSNEIKCPECRAVVIDIVHNVQTRKIVRSSLKNIVADPTENEAIRQSVKESLLLFSATQESQSPKEVDHIAIPVPEVYRGNKRKCNVARVAGICSVSALLILGGLALCYFSFKETNPQIQVVFLIPGVCMTLIGFGVLKFARCR